jgi:hypothetical protein
MKQEENGDNTIIHTSDWMPIKLFKKCLEGISDGVPVRK